MMGEAPEVQGPATLHSLWTGRTTEAFCLWVEKRLDYHQCAKAHAIEVYIVFIRMFSFPDARKAHNRLRWIGKTRKMAGTSGNPFNGSYRVQSFDATCGSLVPVPSDQTIDSNVQWSDLRGLAPGIGPGASEPLSVS